MTTHRLAAIERILSEDDWPKQIAASCTDPAHDPRWCATCEARLMGADWLAARITASLLGNIE